MDLFNNSTNIKRRGDKRKHNERTWIHPLLSCGRRYKKARRCALSPVTWWLVSKWYLQNVFFPFALESYLAQLTMPPVAILSGALKKREHLILVTEKKWISLARVPTFVYAAEMKCFRRKLRDDLRQERYVWCRDYVKTITLENYTVACCCELVYGCSNSQHCIWMRR